MPISTSPPQTIAANDPLPQMVLTCERWQPLLPMVRTGDSPLETVGTSMMPIGRRFRPRQSIRQVSTIRGSGWLTIGTWARCGSDGRRLACDY